MDDNDDDEESLAAAIQFLTQEAEPFRQMAYSVRRRLASFGRLLTGRTLVTTG